MLYQHCWFFWKTKILSWEDVTKTPLAHIDPLDKEVAQAHLCSLTGFSGHLTLIWGMAPKTTTYKNA